LGRLYVLVGGVFLMCGGYNLIIRKNQTYGLHFNSSVRYPSTVLAVIYDAVTRLRHCQVVAQISRNRSLLLEKPNLA